MKALKVFFCFLFFILHFSFSYGQSWIWGQEGYGGVSTGASGCGVATDKDGNAYITGDFEGTVFFGPFTLTSTSYSNMYLAKYDSAGHVIWAAAPTDSGNNVWSIATCIATDPDGNIFVTGHFSGKVIFGSFTLHANYNSNASVFLVKYSANGNVVWAKQSNFSSSVPNNSAAAFSVATDNSGNVFVTGAFGDTITFGAYTLSSESNESFFLVKYDNSGNVLWATQSTAGAAKYNRLDVSCGLSVATDNSGNSFITGYFIDTVSFGTHKLIGISSADSLAYSAFLVKYSPTGNVLWAKQAENGGVHSFGYGYSVVADQDGNSYITGYFDDTVSFDSYTVYSPEFIQAAFLTKYDANGNAVWVKQSSPGWLGFSLASDKGNHIYVSGGLHEFNVDSLVFGNFKQPINPPAKNVSFIIEFNSDGNAECGSVLRNIGYFNNAFDEPNDMSTGVASDASGTYIYMDGGFANDTVECGPDTLTKGGSAAFVGRWKPCTSQVIKGTSENEPCDNLFVPDAFSPNGDGHNDVLYVRSTCISSLEFLVFDRWGNKVFETNNINQGWDGTYNGSPMNMGTYVWYLKGTTVDGASIKEKGSVTLVR